MKIEGTVTCEVPSSITEWVLGRPFCKTNQVIQDYAVLGKTRVQFMKAVI